MTAKATNTSGSDDVTELGNELRSAVGRVYRRFRSERPAGGLGDTALEMLGYLHKTGPQTLTELSEYGRVAAASMSQTVNRLAEAGYVERTSDPSDRRKVHLTATAEGAAIAGAMADHRSAWLETRLRALAPDERATLARASALLARLADS